MKKMAVSLLILLSVEFPDVILAAPPPDPEMITIGTTEDGAKILFWPGSVKYHNSQPSAWIVVELHGEREVFLLDFNCQEERIVVADLTALLKATPISDGDGWVDATPHSTLGRLRTSLCFSPSEVTAEKVNAEPGSSRLLSGNVPTKSGLQDDLRAVQDSRITKKDAYGPGLHQDQYGEPVRVKPAFGGYPDTGDSRIQKHDAYGPGIHMDQYGRPVQVVPFR